MPILNASDSPSISRTTAQKRAGTFGKTPEPANEAVETARNGKKVGTARAMPLTTS